MSGKRRNRERKLVGITYDETRKIVILPNGNMTARDYESIRSARPELGLPALHEITHRSTD